MFLSNQIFGLGNIPRIVIGTVLVKCPLREKYTLTDLLMDSFIDAEHLRDTYARRDLHPDRERQRQEPDNKVMSLIDHNEHTLVKQVTLKGIRYSMQTSKLGHLRYFRVYTKEKGNT